MKEDLDLFLFLLLIRILFLLLGPSHILAVIEIGQISNEQSD